jgi:thiol-disulfide isomerase/thioredoxin
LKLIKLSLLLIVLSLINCQTNEKKDTKSKVQTVFKIIGKQKAENTNHLFLQKKDKDSFLTILTSKKEGDLLVLNSFNKLKTGQYFLQLENNENRIPIWIDNTDLEIFFNHDKFTDSYIIGKSKEQIEYNNYQKERKNVKDLFIFQKKFVLDNKGSKLSIVVLKDMLGETAWRLKNTLLLFNELDTLIQQSDEGQEIINYINSNLEKLANQEVTEPKEKTENQQKTTISKKVTPSKDVKTVTEYAPFFYGNSLNNKELSAKTVFGKNKLTLIDFWASWCRPCRAQTPELVNLYNKYHSKGFEILSIGEDKNIVDWQNAITQDHMNWQHINDDYKRIANMYGVKTIPYAILVNSQGEIIAKKVSSGRLSKLLYQKFGF